MNEAVVGRRARREVASEGSPLLYSWLLVAIFFEYARPGSFVPGLGAVPLNSAIPLGLLLVSSFASGMRPIAEIWRDPSSKWLLFYLGLIILSLAHALVTIYAYRTFIAALGYFFLFILITRIVTTQARLKGVIGMLLFAHLFLIAMNPNAVLNPSARNYIIGGTFLGDGNDFALSLCILLPLAFGLAITQKSRARQIAIWILVAIVLLAIIASQSRGGTLGLGAVLGYLWWRSQQKAYGLVALVAALLVVLAYAPEVYFERMSTIATYEEDSSATARIEAWKAGAKMAVHNPVLGVGAGNFPNNFPRYRGPNAPPRWMTAHSMYFLVLGELGLPGITALLVLIFGSWRLNQRLEKECILREDSHAPPDRSSGVLMLRYLNGALIGFAIAGAFLSVGYYPHVFVLAGLCVVQRSLLAGEAVVEPGKKIERGVRGRAARLSRAARSR